MTDSKQITILSELPVSTLEYFRLALNIAYLANPYERERCGKLCDMVNDALEQKNYDYFTGFEQIDENNPIGI